MVNGFNGFSAEEATSQQHPGEAPASGQHGTAVHKVHVGCPPFLGNHLMEPAFKDVIHGYLWPPSFVQMREVAAMAMPSSSCWLYECTTLVPMISQAVAVQPSAGS